MNRNGDLWKTHLSGRGDLLKAMSGLCFRVRRCVLGDWLFARAGFARWETRCGIGCSRWGTGLVHWGIALARVRLGGQCCVLNGGGPNVLYLCCVDEPDLSCRRTALSALPLTCFVQNLGSFCFLPFHGILYLPFFTGIFHAHWGILFVH